MITTHVLDIAEGGPAVGVEVILQFRSGKDWRPVGRGTTDAHGRITTFSDKPLELGTYQLTFDLGDYHEAQGLASPFFPEAKITFNVDDVAAHYHVPLIVSPYGYSTYRGT